MKKFLSEWREELFPSAMRIAELVLIHLPQEGLVIDVGANIGLVSELVLTVRPSAKAVLFEPIPAYAQYAEGAVGRFSGATVLNLGLSDRVMGATIHAHNSNLGWNTLDAHYSGQPGMTPIEVRLAPLDCYAFGRPDVIKIDVEGWEGKVLAGAHETIAEARPAIIMETSLGSSEAMWQEKVAQLEWLFSIGYRRVDYQAAREKRLDLVLVPEGRPWRRRS